MPIRKIVKKMRVGKEVIAVLLLLFLALIAAYAFKTNSLDKNKENISTQDTANITPTAITGNSLTSNGTQTSGYPACGAENRGGQSVDDTGKPIMTVEEVISKPDDFVGSPIIIHGTVVETYPLKQLFTMGCSCKNIPVKSTGVLPAKGSEVSVYGSVKKTDGGYVFEAEKII
jgi:hypothetical protein